MILAWRGRWAEGGGGGGSEGKSCLSAAPPKKSCSPEQQQRTADQSHLISSHVEGTRARDHPEHAIAHSRHSSLRSGVFPFSPPRPWALELVAPARTHSVKGPAPTPTFGELFRPCCILESGVWPMLFGVLEGVVYSIQRMAIHGMELTENSAGREKLRSKVGCTKNQQTPALLRPPNQPTTQAQERRRSAATRLHSC